MVIDSKRNVDLKKDEGVSLDVRVDNAGFDATGDVTVKTEVVGVSEEDVSNDQEDDATFERESVVVEVCADDVETGVDVGVNLNSNDDTTTVVTNPVVNSALEAIGFSGESGVCNVTDVIAKLDNAGFDTTRDDVDDVDTSVDVGVNLNPNEDDTIDVTDPVDNSLLDAIGFGEEYGVRKVTENIVGLASEGIVDNVVPENKENDGKRRKATVTSKFSHHYELVISPVK